MVKYYPELYRGGHLVPFSDLAKVRSYLTPRNYRYVIEFYDDNGNLYCFKHSPSDRFYLTEQSAIDAAFDLLALVYKQVS